MEKLITAQKIVWQSEKCFGVRSEVYEDARGAQLTEMTEKGRQFLREGKKLAFIPKSQCRVEGEFIVAIENWIAMKLNKEQGSHQFNTEESEAAGEARFQAGCDAYAALLAKAKAAGVKGVRAGMRKATILAKMAEAGIPA